MGRGLIRKGWLMKKRTFRRGGEGVNREGGLIELLRYLTGQG